ncbi:uncharacterized protein E0L32_008960 [Thyridium curvatum]|uniref:NADP-dependent oxidoreductase domain-containing protein n=1 Tax=Thyridium curvatum TaxID=1093900 RepID=A0A507AXP9_9PEZI|nr:uncharacterized protein E0L32_008960 [Thyridium curvatum]TPX09769.1 hypothetical protein E0L32_008960 [Thyridium curvatum]
MTTAKFALEDTVPLPNSEVRMPRLGFGVYQIRGDACLQSCLAALRAGYRHIDSAQLYRNEAEVREAIRRFGLDRSQVFVTSKIRFPESTPDKTYRFCLKSVRRLGGEAEDAYVDLFLVHIPYRGFEERKVMWQALERLLEEKKARAIGVSNYSVEHIEEMKAYAKVWPPHVNQILLHPWNQQREVDVYCKKHGIVVQAFSPLVRAEKLDDPTLKVVAERYGKTPAQVLIRYSLQKGWVPLPKSAKEARIKENADVYDFEISSGDMDLLDSLDPTPHTTEQEE